MRRGRTGGFPARLPGLCVECATKTPGQWNVPLARGGSSDSAGTEAPHERVYFLAAFSAIAAWAAASRAMGTRNGEQLT